MAEPEQHERHKIIALVIGPLVLGGLIGGIIALLASDSGNDDSAAPVTTTTRIESSTTPVTNAPTSPPTSANNGGPPCSSDAILTALKAQDSSVTTVDGFSCADGWAGASYSNANFSSAALLKAQGTTWNEADRATDCGDPSIPADVYHYCEVS